VFNVTSDEFFEHHCNQNYDIIFIDGLHLSEQVTKDIENSLTHLNKGGIIVVHDCLPSAEYQQLREGVSGKPWTGDVWKAFVSIRNRRPDLDMCVVDTDYGCGLIERNDFEPEFAIREYPTEYYTWDFFCHRGKWALGVITVEQFLGRT
jgi:predicted O-methyltransferase YrrM